MTTTRLRLLLFCTLLLIPVMWTATARVTAQTAGPEEMVFDSGLVILGPNQALRTTVLNTGNRNARARFGFMDYGDDGCLAGVVCLHQPSPQTTSEVRIVAPGHALSTITGIEWPEVRVRVRVTGRDPQVRVQGHIVDVTTGIIVCNFDFNA